MEWQFRNDSPIYTQLTQRLTQAIVAGEFRPGERLPSVRELAVRRASIPTRCSVRSPTSNATGWSFPSAPRAAS